MKISAVAERLREMADLLAQGGEKYRARAFSGAADSVEAYRGDFAKLVDQQRLKNLPGVGDTLSKEIAELFLTGKSSWLKKLNASHAKEGAKARVNVRARAAARPKTKARAEDSGQILLGDALRTGDQIVRYLLGDENVATAEFVGDLGRGMETVSTIDLLATGDASSAIVRRFKACHLFSTSRETKEAVTGELFDGTLVRLYVRPARGRTRALRSLLGPPASPRLLTRADIRGAVHCHTNYSDGNNSVAQMVSAAEKNGLEYITITDHSPTAHYAGGVELDRLKRQWEEIDKVQETTKIRIFRGTESDIVRDGGLDYPDAVLEKLDVIVASIHNRYRLDKKAMTERVIRGLRHPLFKIWGHPLGRLLLRRPPIEIDIDRVLEVAAEERVAIELNGDPHRLDMAPELALRAKKLGIPFVVSIDAHSTRDFQYMRTGVILADRAKLTADDVLNTLSASEFQKRVRPRGRA